MLSMLHRGGGAEGTLLLVPGAFSGAWVWRHSFMPWLYGAGFDVHAMSFASHGLRGARLHGRGLAAFLDDLRQVVGLFPEPPVLVAHSLGGLIALRLAQTTHLPGLALLSPVPVHGAWRGMLALARRSPLSPVKMLMLACDPRLTRLGAPPLGIYSEDADPRLRRSITPKLQAESLRALAEMLLPTRLAYERIDTPLHFFAAKGDHIVPAREVRRSAALFGAPVTVYPGLSHTFQAERGYTRVCGDIVAWIRGLRGHPQDRAAAALTAR